MKHVLSLVFIFVMALAGSIPGARAGIGDPDTITITQTGPLPGAIGTWTLVRPDNPTQSFDKTLYVASSISPGTYTVFVTPPTPAITVIELKRNGEFEEIIEKSKITFEFEKDDIIEVNISYIYRRTGIVSVNSQPPGIDFTLIGPNELEVEGTTPASYDEVPEGLYSVTYEPVPGCAAPLPTSDRLEKDSRISFSITYDCDNMAQIDEYEKSLTHVSVAKDGRMLTFHDVPLDEWFSVPVHTVVKTGVMGGYTDKNGNPTGEFGLSNVVTIAELSKIAHTIAGLDENERRGTPLNTLARNSWFSDFFSSAESRDWLVFRDRRMNPGRAATRAEVVTTLLHALDVPRYWPRGDLFTDVDTTTQYAASIETAARDGIIEGFTDRNGKKTGKFGPDQPINRAELAKVLSATIDVYGQETPTLQPDALDL